MTRTVKEPTNHQLIEEKIGYLFEKELIDELKHNGHLGIFKSDQTILNIGDTLAYMPIVLSGSVKVLRENDEGEDLLLYYIEGGDTCAMTMQCCVRQTESQIKAIAVEDTALWMIPLGNIERWMLKYASWREYVLSSYHSRMMELLETIDAIAFMRLDERLLKYLTDQAKLLGSLEIHATHQQIADDLHSSRVVISRLLKQLEVKGVLHLHRNKIELKSI
jgi:CRP/FNR family transcriptional regulator